MQIKFLFRLLIAYTSRFKGVIFSGVVIGIIIFFILSLATQIIFKGTTRRIGITGRYRADQLPSYITHAVGNGLTKMSASHTPEPDLATSWETPDKGKTWIFHLREAYWQDGSKLTAQSLAYDFTDVTIEYPDEKTISFKLANPYAAFPAVVSKPVFRKGLLGTGAWDVKNINFSGQFVNNITLENKNKDKLIYKFYPTTESTITGFKLGEIDEVEGVFEKSPYDSWELVNIESRYDEHQVVTLFFNTEDAILSEKSLRQALTYAIDKEKLGVRAISSISPSSWAHNPQVKDYNFDIDRANELLEDFPDEQKEGLEIKLVSSPELLSVADVIAKDWQKIGVKTLVQVSSIRPSEFQAYLIILDLPGDPDQYPIWHSTQELTNISNYKNQRIDKLLEDGRAALDIEDRRKIYLDFQRFLLEDLPAAFLYHPTYYTVRRK